ncbi:hypothetical protein [Streptomyces iconiensis]|uniref:PH domain-containing protein n=1 Tax=Streptomyces iconiensis TaxID=1384038 RepID=A0ABT6ZTI9_9ACTN|nr:hypothetical protein [Streptomyces iconiensis]MDJ1132375.1 hypothetical protein [Streptomyces iconiensis]
MNIHLVGLAAEQKSQEVTDWASRAGWVVGLVLFIALLYWLMRQGWKWRGTLQGDLPELPQRPAETGKPLLVMTGRYHGSTSEGQWLDRIVAQGLGTRSRAELTLTREGLDVVRPGAQDFFVPAEQLRGARLDTGIAGKVLTEGGLLVITWEHGDRRLDSGFRFDHSARHAEWAEKINEMSGDNGVTATQHNREGA